MPTLKVKQAVAPSVAPTRAEIIAAHSLPHFLAERGEELRSAGRNFVTNACPVAQHKKYHGCVTIDTEKNLWHCNDCDHGGTVIDWVMLEKNMSATDAMRILGDGRNSSQLPNNKSTNSPARRLIAKTYDYTDESGKRLFQCVRFRPKGFSQRRPDGKGGWIWNLDGVRRVLYRLPEVLKAQSVCVAEGEKDCDNLRALGFTATTNPMGAGNWLDEYGEMLRGKDVVIFQDVDDDEKKKEKVRRHVEDIIRSLTGKAKSIRLVVLPDGFHDISDYIASLPVERAAETIRTLINETPEVDLKSGNSVDVDEPEPGELPPPRVPYIPPTLELLPSVLQEYVHAAAESLNVDVSFILLPLLSSLGTGIGNSRSILLKPGYVQPPVIWTGIIGKSGTRKSPSLELGCLAVREYEGELKRQNEDAAELYADELSRWESQKGKGRGHKPEKPPFVTCTCDDLTIEALADILVSNPRGILVGKDELSHWLASFDQYKPKTKGSDVSRWLSLHSAVFLAVDRRTDSRHYRIIDPRVSITGCIQPKILHRAALTPEFFERGLPARFIFAYPPFRQDKWSEATLPDKLRAEVLTLFEQLWLLQPSSRNPQLLPLGRDAKAVFVDFYNECGEYAVEASEHEEAAWSKLTGYGARFALIGQLAHDPRAEVVTGAIMEAACRFAGWSGNESVRIYAELSDTREQRELRELIEFIERRGGAVYERDVMQSFTRLKNDKEGTARELDALVKAGRGKWEPIDHGGGPGRPARKFQLLRSSTSTQFGISRGKTRNSVDVDTYRDQEITPTTPPDGEPAGVSVPLLITRRMEVELLRRGLTQSEIDKLTPQQAHQILAGPAAPVASIVRDEFGVGRL